MDSNYVIISGLATTVPEELIYESMRGDFNSIIGKCGITQRLDYTLPPTYPIHGLIPFSFNLMTQALRDDALMDRLQQNAHQKIKYWFFNIFIVPTHFDGYLPDNLLIQKGTTRGIEWIDFPN